ncbi:MAG: type III pantothenate kinase [Bacteroidales bacterium]|nr:type III pantothenate kinase [Bacteroidales bacterium]
MICIDAGNTFIKIALMEHSAAISQAVFPYGKPAKMQEYLQSLPAAEGVIVASVSLPAQEIFCRIPSKISVCMELTGDTPTPVRNLYQTPASLGKDRLAAAVGAYRLYPQKDILVIDAGTALTFDFIDRQGNFIGGNISPGLNMRFQALHSYTKKIPLATPTHHYRTIGNSTEAAVIAGVQNGIIFEMNEYIRYFKRQNSETIFVMTGGDLIFFVNKIESLIFAQPNLVHIGLEEIFKYNVK